MKQQPERSVLFLVRVCLDELGQGDRSWRGKVQHLASGQTFPFHDWHELEATMIQMVRPGDGEEEEAGEEGEEARQERRQES